MKKKILSAILITALIASVSSCGSGSSAATAPSTAAGDRAVFEGAGEKSEGGEAPVTTVAPSFAEDYDASDYGYDESFDVESAEAGDDSMDSRGDQRRAGLLSGGEWRDNSNFVFWTKLFEQHEDWNDAENEWHLTTRQRVFVRVKDANGAPAAGMTVKLTESGSKTIVWEAVTDSRGEAFLFCGIDTVRSNSVTPDEIVVENADGRAVVTPLTKEMRSSYSAIEIAVPESSSMRTELDLMLMIDTTGSMGDELKYLQTELNDVINRVENATNADVQLSVNFYRDAGDDYVVRDYGFTSNISIALDHLKDQRSSGGGDYPEAVISALDNGINAHQWRDKSEKIMLLVLDAPPHKDEALVSLKPLIQQAAKLGIRIIPVASSGVDTYTEFLCRCMAMATGGTYTFLTDDSGIGNSHLEPTIGAYTVEKLNDMLVRLISDYFSQEPRSYAEPYYNEQEQGNENENENVNEQIKSLLDDGRIIYPANYTITSDYFSDDDAYTSGIIHNEDELRAFYEKYGKDFSEYDDEIDFSEYMFAYMMDLLSSGSITVDESKGVYCTINGDVPEFFYTLDIPEVGTTDIKTLILSALIPVSGNGEPTSMTAAVTTAAAVVEEDWTARMEKVDEAISSVLEDASDLTLKERAEAMTTLLESLADSGLVVRKSIYYDGDDLVSFEYDIGGGETVLGGVSLTEHDTMMN
ncbi:MAG: VWA domain-containing protein [Ruminiclostridium sp.]|nr:VWA domain-containing protein [Ruminiclostridium sp.]